MKNKSLKKYIFCVLIILVMIIRLNVFADEATVNCDSWGAARQDLQNLFDFMKIIIPILVIGLSTYDFIKAVTSKDDKNFKKAFQTLMKRLAYAVIFFFLPVILNLLLDLFGTNSSVCIG